MLSTPPLPAAAAAHGPLPAWQAQAERLIVVVGPSGAGKDSVLRRWRERLQDESRIAFVQRWITRPADPLGEAHRPVDAERFAALRDAGVFAFDWQAHGLHYGVPHDALAPLQRGGWVVVNGSREHLPRLRAQAPRCRIVEITAPDVLRAQRLAGRAREDAAAVQARLARRVPAPQPSLRLVNDGDLAACVDALHAWWCRLAATDAACPVAA